MNRLSAISAFLFLLFTLLILQFYKIQIIDGEKWVAKASCQHQFKVNIPAKRGVFYATPAIIDHPTPPKALVIDVAKFHIYIDPEVMPKHLADTIAAELSDRVDGSFAQIREQFDKQARSRRIAKWIGRDRKTEIEGWWRSFARAHKIPSNAVFFVQDWQRSYPCGSLMGQLLHTVRENKAPTGGLELFFDGALAGKSGERILMRSPRHALEADQTITQPVHGQDIFLTIDPTLQAIAEEEIAKGVDRVHANSGWAIMMDPHNGHILALAQYPFFDPSKYSEYFNSIDRIEDTKVRAITDCYEPGSTLKPMTVVIALLANEELMRRGEKPLFSPDEKIRSDDGRVPGTSHTIRDVTTHKYLNMELAIIKSSNVYLGKLTQRICERLGENWYRDQLENIFGFSHKTGIELPSESRGMLPRPGRPKEWSKPTPYVLAIGYNLLVNSLQMTRAFAMIANGGLAVKPTLIRDTKPVLERKFSQKISDQIIDALKLVTKPGGSSTRADVRGYTEAGKSGSAEKIIDGSYSKKIHYSSFVGFAPAHHARFVLFIGIDEPEYRYIPGYGKTHYGGKCAAPVFRNIATRALHYLGVPPDDPYGYPIGDPRYNPEKADSLDKMRALRGLYDEWNKN